jgi:hypothetical protein
MKINGSLVFDASSASEIQNLRVQKVSANPTAGSADVGRLIFNTVDNTIYIGREPSAGVYAWVGIATGGDASALQTEVDAIETSLGAIVTTSGVFVPGQVTIEGSASTASDLTGLLQEISNAIAGKDTLAELLDVSVASLADNNLLQYNSTTSKWENVAIGSASGVQAYDAGLDALAAKTSTGIVVQTGNDTFTSVALTAPAAGITITNADGTTGSPTFALANDLAGVEGLTTTGLAARTADGAWSTRTLTAPAAGITITNADGVAGDPVFALANDLAALEGLATTGYIVRTGDGTAVTRSIAGTAGRIDVLNGDGVSSDTSIDLATVTNSGTGSFLKLTTDSYGRVTGTTAVVEADITALVDGVYVNVAGDTMTGTLNMDGNTITGLATAINATDAVNKAYVDALQNGLSWKQAVRIAFTSNVADLATLVASNAFQGVTLAQDDRILLTGQTDATQNGIYVVQADGVPMRAADMNDPAEFDGAAVFVKEGDFASSAWTETATVTTVGTDPVQFSEFSGGYTYTWGTGLSASGNTINVNLGAGIAQLPTDEVGIDVASGLALQLTSTDTTGQLTFVLDTGSGLEQSATGLKISAGGVTNAMLAHSQFTINGDTGTDSLVLGDTLQIKGDSVQGVSTSVTESPAGTSTFTITAADASSSQKGVASFNSNDFTVTAGNVVIAAGGVDNAQLANSTITVSDGTASDAVALGETLTVVGDGAAISTAVTANQVAVSARLASTSQTGVASFASADFAVSGAGEVTAVAKDLDWLTDVTITSASAGDMLVNDGAGQFVNRKVYFLHDQTTAATTWTVSHNLGQKYCNVTVVDASDEVVIPQSITFDSTTQLTVTFNSALAGKVVVMGV